MRKYFKLLTFLFLFLSLLTLSCEKEPITPGNYQDGESLDETDNWVDDYVFRGSLPVWDNNVNQNQHELVGTTWVLTKVTTAYATTYPNDTIRFVNNNNYTLNNGAIRPYVLSSGIGTTNNTLSFYYFQPFGGSHYSGQVGFYFVQDGQISQAEFHNIQNTTNTVLAWFTKI